MHKLATLAFFAKHSGLQSFKADPHTKRAVIALEKAGFLKVSWKTLQAEFTGKVFV